MEEKRTDEELFQAFLTEGSSFDTLMERYGNRVCAYIAGRIEDAQEAEDLMIEAFARVIEAKPSFTEEGTFRAYLFKTARTVAIRFNKKYHLHNHFEYQEAERKDRETGDHTRNLEQKERNRVLQLCMKDLPPDYREALYLKYFEEMTSDQIGRVMGGKNRKKVENILRRGRQALRELLREKGITDAYD